MKKQTLKHTLAVVLAAVTVTASLSGCAVATGDSGNAASNAESGTGAEVSGSDSEAVTADTTEAAAASTDEVKVKPDNAKWTVTIPGNNGSLCNVPTFIAYEKGFLAEEGVDADLVSADYEAKKVGLNNGTMPIVNGDFMYFPSIEENLNITVVDGIHRGCIRIQVLPDSDIASPEDLRGKTIACDEIGGTPYQIASLWLGQAGVKAIGDGAEVTFLPFTDDNLSVEALKKGEVDAIAIWDPVAAIVEKSGDVKTILDIGADEPFSEHYCCYLYASTKVLEEDPAQIAAILRAYRKAEDWISKNPEEATAIIVDKGYVSIEDRDLALNLVKSYGYQSTEDFSSGKALDVEADVLYFAQALYDVDYLKTSPDEYIKKAYTAVDLNQ